MVDYDIGQAKTSDYNSTIETIEVAAEQTDGIQDQKETTYTNENWGSQLGIYKNIPEFKIALDMRAIWTIGEEVEADNRTKVIMDNITGWGKSTFREILKNMLIVKRLGEDSFAEIVRNDKGTLINLKVLDSGSIRQVYDRKGILIRYEQVKKVKDSTTVQETFKPNQIFHLTNKRIADEIHGTSDSDALKDIIEASNESFDDVRKLMHRYIKPMMKWILATDKESEIDAFITKVARIRDKGDDIFIPKDTVEHELISVPSNSTLNPMPWRDHLRNYFFQVCGIPQIIMGSSGEFTEATAKIAYLAFEQSVKDEQTDTIEQVWDQLALRIKLSFPASLQNELLSDTKKDATNGITQPAEMQPNLQQE